MNPLTALSVTTLFALAASAAAAEQSKPALARSTTPPVVEATAKVGVAVDPGFSALDKDGDASLLQTDFPTAHDLSTDLFAAFDTNSDQRLSSAEYAVYSGGRAGDDSADDEEEAE